MLAGPLDAASFSALGFHRVEGGMIAAETANNWAEIWQALEPLVSLRGAADVEAIVLPATQALDAEQARNQLRPYGEMQQVARSLWLGEALLADRVMSYLQPIVDAEGAVFGYEALARALQPDGSVISGYDIMEASRALNIEFRLDRYLHHRAVRAFAEMGSETRLFINFFSGFIHRPEVYLDGITQEMQRCKLPPETIVLDLTRPETQKNFKHLQSIADYCRTKGYCIALDDIVFPEQAEKLIEAIRPHFIKIDPTVTKHVDDPAARHQIETLVELAHRHHARAIGEGVESEAIYHALLTSQIDLFQGYYIGEPLPAERQNKKASA